MAQPLSSAEKQEWQKRILKQQESGLSIKQWCCNHQIPVHAFYYWKKRLHFANTPLNRSSFFELPQPKKENGITIEYCEFRVLLEKGFEPSILKQCLTILKELSC